MNIVESIRAALDAESAASVAELFLSPHVNQNLLIAATETDGPALWIVNRSDVSTRTLQMLSHHTIAGIAQRAREKINFRAGTLKLLEPPELPADLSQVGDESVEDVLGHPLVPFEAISYFFNSRSEDVRASAALGLARRLFEYPPNWTGHQSLKSRIEQQLAKVLLEDLSPYVRAYAARVPLIDSDLLQMAIGQEHHPRVRAKLLQHESLTERGLDQAVRKCLEAKDPFEHRILALDHRLKPEHRRTLESFPDTITKLIHLYHHQTADKAR